MILTWDKAVFLGSISRNKSKRLAAWSRGVLLALESSVNTRASYFLACRYVACQPLIQPLDDVDCGSFEAGVNPLAWGKA
jgi:hypothetical protein